MEARPTAREVSLPQVTHQQRPAWWREQGLVMAGVDWEALLPRLRAGSFDRSEAFKDYDEKMAIWRSEHSEAIARRLKEMGFNFLMIPLYKGGGTKAERQSMEDAKRFTKICHGLGLRVGSYTFSGTILYEPMLAENPDAKDWFAMDSNGRYVPYGPLYFRRYANRSHPGFRALLRDIVRFAVEEANVDLIHFDNYVMGPSYEPYSVEQFREYLRNRYSPEERRQRFGFTGMEYIQPPPAPPKPDEYNGDPLYQDFIDYRCEVMAATYRELADFARSLNPEIVVELNPGGYVGELITTLGIGTLDHTRTIQWGGAFWDEGYPSHLENGVMISRFRSQMIGRYFNNMVFDYTADRVAMAESMANNLQCLGCPAWVNGDQVTPYLSRHNPKKFDPAVLESIRFFHREQQYYRDAELVADVGVLNTYANTAYGPRITRERWAAFTQALYQGKMPMTLVPDSAPGNLSRFRVLVLADLALISDQLLNALREYVQQGGGLVMTGEATLFDEHSFRRQQAGLADLFSETPADNSLHAKPGKGRAVYLPEITIPDKFRVGMLPENRADLLEAVRWAAGGPLQVEVTAPETVTMSLYVQPTGRRILHLVNYDEGNPVTNIEVHLQLPGAKRASSAKLLSPDFDGAQTLALERTGLGVRFTAPRLDVYGMVVVE
ncbi:MAG: hypothetical protein ACRD2B_08845 [Terriglobia bacterium]